MLSIVYNASMEFRKIYNRKGSYNIVIPKPIVRALKIQEGDMFGVAKQKDIILMRKVDLSEFIKITDGLPLTKIPKKFKKG